MGQLLRGDEPLPSWLQSMTALAAIFALWGASLDGCGEGARAADGAAHRDAGDGAGVGRGMAPAAAGGGREAGALR